MVGSAGAGAGGRRCIELHKNKLCRFLTAYFTIASAVHSGGVLGARGTRTDPRLPPLPPPAFRPPPPRPQDGKLAVLVGTVTDDVRLYEVPKLRLCALRVTETARARILKVRAVCAALRAALCAALCGVLGAAGRCRCICADSL